MSRDGRVALPRGVMGLSAGCDCGISWSYSRTFFDCSVDLMKMITPPPLWPVRSRP